MRLASMISVGVAAFAIAGPIALAQQPRTGTITEINRLNNTIAIRLTQNGTVGANTGGAAEEFKVGSGVSLEALHAGDSVNFSTSEAAGAKTIMKLERR
jgi:Copper binding periplasmic protein CusF